MSLHNKSINNLSPMNNKQVEEEKPASLFDCIECGKQAVCFWPAFDPDIPSSPYCRECVEKAKMELITKLCMMDR